MWIKFAAFILRNRLPLLIFILASVAFLVFQINLKFSTSAAQLLPSDDPDYVNYQSFENIFGQENNLITLGFSDTNQLKKGKNYQAWIKLLEDLKQVDGVEEVLYLENAIKLEKDSIGEKFITNQLLKTIPNQWSKKEYEDLIAQTPIYEGRFYNPETGAIQALIYVDDQLVDSPKRIPLIRGIEKVIAAFESTSKIDTKLSGMPVIRVYNTEQVKKETTRFIILALGVTCLIFFIFFRSVRSTLITMLVVSMAVIISLAVISLLGYEVTMLTGLVPPLIIVIGVPNCIFLINKYLQEYSKHQNKILALVRMILKVGNATILTNTTTAFGFFTFVFTNSSTLREFGTVASISILSVFVLSITIIPILYSFLPVPNKNELKMINKQWLGALFGRLEKWVFSHRRLVYIISIFVFAASIVGIMQMKSSGNILDDMSKDHDFYKDILFFDKEFGGILPLDIYIDTKQKQGVMKLTTLKNMDAFSNEIEEMKVGGRPISLAPMIKLSRQAYYGGNPKYYSLPRNQERGFILRYIKNSKGEKGLLNAYLDSTQSKTRITLMLRNEESEALETIVDSIEASAVKSFPKENYDHYLTGAAYLFMKGAEYLTKNLMISLSLAILIITLFMAFMFRSYLMILVALIPNILPLFITAGFMGFFDIGLKPSTILVFSIAFGIAVDDTIHFLAKYRQELKAHDGNISNAVRVALKDTGISMFFTSVVLFFGFATFTFSGFHGIVALGGLVSITLVVAMLSNLVLLPSLLLSYEKMTNKEFISPEVDYFEDHEDEVIDMDELDLPKE